jgi:hypothetical protein
MVRLLTVRGRRPVRLLHTRRPKPPRIDTGAKKKENHRMTGTRDDFIATARAVAPLFRDPAVTAAWDEPSALAEFSVGGLVGHIAYQVVPLTDILAAPEPTEPVITVMEHYGRVAWIGADLDAEINVRIRREGEEIGAEGPCCALSRAERAPATITAF